MIMIKHLEKNLDDLESIVSTLEKGETSLSDALSLFEKGVKLTQVCQKTLSQVEQKIKTITQPELEPDEDPAE